MYVVASNLTMKRDSTKYQQVGQIWPAQVVAQKYTQIKVFKRNTEIGRKREIIYLFGFCFGMWIYGLKGDINVIQ